MDFTYKGVVGGGEPEMRTFDVASGAVASIAPGDIVVIADGYAAKAADGEGTSGQLLGLAVSTSTDAVATAGTVEVQFSPTGLIVQGLATTPSNLVTAVVFDKVTLDVAAGVIKVDENDAGAGQVLIYEIDSDSATTGICRVVLPFAFYDS